MRQNLQRPRHENNLIHTHKPCPGLLSGRRKIKRFMQHGTKCRINKIHTHIGSTFTPCGCLTSVIQCEHSRSSVFTQSCSSSNSFSSLWYTLTSPVAYICMYACALLPTYTRTRTCCSTCTTSHIQTICSVWENMSIQVNTHVQRHFRFTPTLIHMHLLHAPVSLLDLISKSCVVFCFSRSTA